MTVQVVAGQECKDLWIGGRGPLLLLAYSILLSAMTYLAATNRAMNFLEQREAVNLTLQVALSVGVLLTLLVSADAISGERERGTLESLLLTPVGRRAIVVGKLTAAMTLWLACLLVALPYLWVLGRGVAVAGSAALLGFCVGTLVALGLGSLGLLISAGTNSNKTSLAISLLVLLIFFAPTQIPALPKTGIGEFLTRANPVGSALTYIAQVLVSHRSWTDNPTYLAAPALLAAATLTILIVAGPKIIKLNAGVTSS
ncbi:ABC transporter permease subunit [Kribbella sp. NPDC051718]|uniref:ABC transporter permease n=1 Tax=Kribbella sp. NPDC051718 TaxID=3155168 RepID=UPI00341EBD14